MQNDFTRGTCPASLGLLVASHSIDGGHTCTCSVPQSPFSLQAESVLDLLQNILYKPVKRFQMKSNGCRDVQHTSLQSTQTRRTTGKQGAQTRGSSAHLNSQASLHQWLHDNCSMLINSKLQKVIRK